MSTNLCQGCMCLKPEKQLHIPHEHEDIEKDIEVCEPCHRRISNAIKADSTLGFSVVGNRILGIKTKLSRYDYSEQYAEHKGLSVTDYFRKLAR